MAFKLANSISRFFLSVFLLAIYGTAANAQIGGLAGEYGKNGKDLQLADDSPFRDPDIIYLEADELENDEEKGIITALGSVEGRYQDKTIRADEVRYYTKDGRVFAIGNVVLVNADGSSQYADKLELSDELEAGTATNFLARFPKGGQLASAFAARRTDAGIELYNAYYTACKACKNEKTGKTKKPTWQLKAKKVSQDKDTKSIRYRDAVFEFKGVPIMYTPYLAHPDPSVGRASGWLIPFGGLSVSKGLNARAPYYFALSPSSELTITPRVYQKVNPLLQAEYRKKFYSGEFNFEGSFTYSSFFDRRGRVLTDADFFANPDENLKGKKLRSHFFTNGLFELNKNWKWGFEAGYATDDNYLDRYDLDELRPEFGLYRADTRRLAQQAFIVGQSDDFRFSTSAFGTVSLRNSIRRDENNFNRILVSRENDSILPVVAPKIEFEKYFKDPIGGRFKLFGDATILTRGAGTDYIRTTAGLDWSKTFIAPLGVEVKPFAQSRFDFFQLQAENQNLSAEQQEKFDFNRTLGQAGIDIRWPFVRPGKNISWTIEPRVQITNNFGDGKTEKFLLTDNNGRTISLLQDSLDIDLDQSLIWSPNKSTGFDLWQKGLRADIGASLSADWGKLSRLSLFLGQSYSDNKAQVFPVTSGIDGDKTDIVGQVELNLGKNFYTRARLRYDDDNNAFRRLDTSLGYNSERFSANARYYRLDSVTARDLAGFNIPSEEISGSLRVKLFDNWSTRYTLYRDIDQKINRRQTLSLIYNDHCTMIELMYNRDENNLGIIGNSEGFGIRVSLLTLGDFAPD